MNCSRHLSALLLALFFAAALCKSFKRSSATFSKNKISGYRSPATFSNNMAPVYRRSRATFSKNMDPDENLEYNLQRNLDVMKCSFLVARRMKDNGRNDTLTMLRDLNITQCFVKVNYPVDYVGFGSSLSSIDDFSITNISVMIMDGMNETGSNILDIQIAAPESNEFLILYYMLGMWILMVIVILCLKCGQKMRQKNTR
ncbi:uncharacterized protein LOC118189103 isoform X2 [Stegodyphus dumicola]|nr:uncharacterized protein LOC118189103 isoform X2 [Stegodyphus dumicola]